jgi:hypothetical protein
MIYIFFFVAPYTNFREQPHRQVIATQPLPSFHMFGFGTQVVGPLYCLLIAALYPPVATTGDAQPMQPTPQNAIEHTRRANCVGMYAIPAWLQIWAQDSQVVDFLTKLDFVVCRIPFPRVVDLYFFQAYGGGPLPNKVGDGLIAAGVRIASLYGGTEFGSPVDFHRGSVDWEYTSFSKLAKIRWDHQGDGFYELQFLAGLYSLLAIMYVLMPSRQTCDTHRLAVENLPDVKGYATSDLWAPHPTKPDLWKL